MPFIAVISKENDSNFIKKEVLKRSCTKIKCVNINKSNIQNLKNIRFETLVIDDDFENILENSKYIEKIIKNTKYLIVNTDLINNVINLSNSEIITYGLNSKAIITISSIKHDNFFIYLQKPIQDINKNLIEEQEFNIQIGEKGLNKIHNWMVIFTILLIYGYKLQKI